MVTDPFFLYFGGIIIIGGLYILLYVLFLYIEFRIARRVLRNVYRYVTKEEYEDNMTYVNKKPYTISDLLRKN